VAGQRSIRGWWPSAARGLKVDYRTLWEFVQAEKLKTDMASLRGPVGPVGQRIKAKVHTAAGKP
jgi:hypothetical protein